MNELEELKALRRMAELEDKAGGKQSLTKQTELKSSPSLMDVATGPETMGDWASGRINDFKRLGDPETWKNLGNQLVQKPAPIALENGRLPKPPDSLAPTEGGTAAMDMALSVMPVSAMGKVARSTMLSTPKTGAELIKQQTLDMAGQSGYSVPRSNIKQTTLTNLGERIGGKQAIEATAQIKNQPITNKLAAKALGVAEDTAITPDLLNGIRKEAGKAYDVVSKLGTLTADKAYATALRDISQKFSGASKDFPELASQEVLKLTAALSKKTISSEGAVEMVKNLRQQASGNLGPMSQAKDKLLGKAQRAAADAMEDLIERNIAPGLGSEVLNAYKSARQLIAKTYTVEKALNESTGNVSASMLAKAADKGVPLSGELKKIASFSKAFPRITREPIGAPASGGLFEPMVYGTAGSLATGPAGAMAAAVPIIGKPIARKLMTTVPKKSEPLTGNMSSTVAQALARMLSSGNVKNLSQDQTALINALTAQEQR